MDTMETTTRAAELKEMFETRTRDDGSTFVGLKDDSPEWAHDFVREAHGVDLLPDDHRYQWISEALDVLVEDQATDADELATRFADDVDIYTADLIAWVSSNLHRVAYCDEVLEEGMTDPTKGIVGILMAGQASERFAIFANVLAALENIPE